MSFSVHSERPMSDTHMQAKLETNDDNEDLAIGVALSCDDMSNEGSQLRLYRFYHSQHRTVDLVRATVVKPCPDAYTAASGGAARATFSSPVMSRRHARLTFANDRSITFTDVGSMHGSYMQTAVVGTGHISDKLIPNKPYMLRSGDIIHLGKVVYRDNKCWNPVVLRVTLLYDGDVPSHLLPLSVRPPFRVTPVLDGPNRYGVYDEEEEDISSSSDDEDEVDSGSSQQRNSSSPETSPISPHLSIGHATDANHVDDKNLPSVDNSNADGLSSAGMSSRGSRLRSMLPLPLQSLQSFQGFHNLQLPSFPLPPLRPLPSLRDLGFFSSSTTTGGPNLGVGGDESVASSSDAVEVGDVTLSIATHSPGSDSKSNVYEYENQNGCSFTYSTPSFPGNQLGLVDAESNPIPGSFAHAGGGNSEGVDEVVQHDSLTGNGNYSEEGGEEDDIYVSGPEIEVVGGSRSLCVCECEDVEEDEEQEQEDGLGDEEYEAPMEISPSPSLNMSPIFGASAIRSGVDADVNDSDLDEGVGYQRVEEEARHEAEGGTSYSAAELVGRRPAATAATANRRASLSLLLSHSSEQPFTSKSIVGSASASLHAQIQSLEARMLELRRGTVALRSKSTSAVSSSSSTIAPQCVGALAVSDGLKKELEGMREEMRRLSRLMESILAKMNEPTHASATSIREPEAASLRIEQAVQVCDEGVELEQSTQRTKAPKHHNFTDLSSMWHTQLSSLSPPSTGSVKRKRVDDEEEVTSLASSNSEESLSALETNYEPPAKRARTSSARRVVRRVAAAAGYTSLGAAIAWTALAYVL